MSDVSASVPRSSLSSVPDDGEYDRWIHVDEQTGNLVERVEDQRVSPCNYSTSEWA